MIKITKINILIRKGGTDYISLTTDKSPPFICFPKEKLKLSFETTHGKGLDYILNNFPGIPYHVIEEK